MQIKNEIIDKDKSCNYVNDYDHVFYYKNRNVSLVEALPKVRFGMIKTWNDGDGMMI